MVTGGSQQGLDLVARTLLDEGDLVALDDPSYLGAVQSFRGAGARLLPLPTDRDGMRVDVSRAVAAGARPTLVYVVPHFHNPTGGVLTTERRRELAALADRYGFLIVEDDPYGDLAFDGAAAVHGRARRPGDPADEPVEDALPGVPGGRPDCPGGPARRTGGGQAEQRPPDEHLRAVRPRRTPRRPGVPARPPRPPAHPVRGQGAGDGGVAARAAAVARLRRPRGGLFFWCSVDDPGSPRTCCTNTPWPRGSRSCPERRSASSRTAPGCCGSPSRPSTRSSGGRASPASRRPSTRPGPTRTEPSR